MQGDVKIEAIKFKKAKKKKAKHKGKRGKKAKKGKYESHTNTVDKWINCVTAEG